MKYIGLISSAASGKLGGIVASHNRGGQYFRKHSIPVQPRTSAQRLVRNQLAGLSSAFKGLTAAQVGGWNALGSTVTLKNKIGQTYHPTGQQLYVSCNKHLAELGISTAISTAPTIPTIPAFTTFTMTNGAANTTVTVMNYAVSPALPANFGAVVRATSVASNGRSFFGKSLYRTLTGYAAATSVPASLFTIYTNKFGPLPQTGQISFELKLIDPNSGFAGPVVSSVYSFSQPNGSNLFSLAVASQTGTTTTGSGTVTFVCTPTANGSFAGAITYSVLGLPANCTYSFGTNPKSVASTDTLSVVAASATPGTYSITIAAAYGTFEVTQTATLTIA